MDWEGTVPVRAEVLPQGWEPLKKNQCAFRHQEGQWKSECPQLQARHKMTKERGLYGAYKPWATRGLGPTGLFPPWPPRAHGPYVSRGPTCRFHDGHWHRTFCGDPMGGTNLKKHQTFVGTTGIQALHPFLQLWKCILRGHLMTHKFLYIPECPMALMSRDLLSKLQAQISFQEDGQTALSFNSGPPRVLALIAPPKIEIKFSRDCLKGARNAF
jgi:hypothetical protein